MRTLEEIQYEVAQWSQANFGQQQSKANPDLFLGSLAPLLGLVEEVGELLEAENEEEIRDALADIGIYLCDYAAREGFILPEPSKVLDDSLGWSPQERTEDDTVGIMICLGNLCHVTLKRHQGIRGMEDPDKYRSLRDEAVKRVIFFCHRYMEEEYHDDWLTEVADTWDQTVKNRDWKTNPQDAAD